ncbi:MAG: VCBS repeat-containing protein [bacterium]
MLKFILITIIILNSVPSWAKTSPTLIKWFGQSVSKSTTAYQNIILSDRKIITTRYLKGIEIWQQDDKGSWTIVPHTGLPSDGSYQGLAIGDVNQDGKLDIIATLSNSGISLWLGEDNLKWNKISTNLPRINSYFGVEVADLNSDGSMDIVSASQFGIKVWAGDGTGKNWIPQNHGLPDYKYYYKVVITDFNRDGKLDIVATNNDGGGVKAWRGNGQGKWMNTSNGLPGYGNYYGLATSDVNLDGKLDIIAGSSKNGPGIWLGDGNGNWSDSAKSPLKTRAVFSLFAYDFNLDGYPDIAAGTDEGIKVWVGDGQGNWQLASSGLPTENFYQGLAVGDINLDGRPDIIGANSAGIQLCLSNPAPVSLLGWIGQIGYTTDGLQPEYGTSGTIFTYKLNYINNLPPKEGHPKVGIYKGQTLIGTYTMKQDNGFYYFETCLKEKGSYSYQFEAEDIAGNKAIGTPIYPQMGPMVDSIHPHIWAQKTTPDTSHEHYGIAIADFNLDGVADIVCATPQGVKAWIRTNNHWQPASFGLDENKFYYGVALADFNLDGKLDIVATSIEGLDVWFGDGDGRWNFSSNELPSTGFFYGVICGDFNFDGKPDIVAGTNDNKGVQAWSGDGRGNWKNNSKGLPTDGHLCSVALVDFNSDENLDIVAGDYTGIRFLLQENMTKFNTCSTIYDLPTPPGFQLAGLPDVLFGRFDGITKGFAGDGRGNWTYTFTNLAIGEGIEVE